MEAILAVAGAALAIGGTLAGLVWAAVHLTGRPLPIEWLERTRDPWRALVEKPFVLEQRSPVNGHA